MAVSPLTSPSSKGYWAQKAAKVARYSQEGEDDASWFQHEKHILVFSAAGKAVFSRYGDELRLGSIIGPLNTIINTFKLELGSAIKVLFAGRHKVVFLSRGELHLIAISRTVESVPQLVQQLEYTHDHFLSVLTARLHVTLKTAPRSDVRHILAGTELLLHDLINMADSTPAPLFEALQVLRLPAAARAKVLAALKKPLVKNRHLLYALVVAGGRLVSVAKAKDAALHTADVHILINFVTNSQSFRTSESWAPVCLPRFSDKGQGYCYTNYIAPDVCVAMFSVDPSDFPQLREARVDIEATLGKAGGPLEEIRAELARGDWTADSIELGCPDLRHFMYKHEPLGQVVVSAPAEPYVDARSEDRGQLELFRLYERVCARLGSGPNVKANDRRHLVHYEVSNHATVLGWVRPGEFELYATFLPVVAKDAVQACSHRILRWVKKEEANLFLM